MIENDLSKEDWTVTKAMELLPLTCEEISMLIVNGKITPEDTVSDIREVVKEVKQLRIAEETKETEKTEEAEETEETEEKDDTGINVDTTHEYWSAKACEADNGECIVLTSGNTIYKMTLTEFAEITRKYKFTELV